MITSYLLLGGRLQVKDVRKRSGQICLLSQPREMKVGLHRYKKIRSFVMHSSHLSLLVASLLCDSTSASGTISSIVLIFLSSSKLDGIYGMYKLSRSGTWLPQPFLFGIGFCRRRTSSLKLAFEFSGFVLAASFYCSALLDPK